MPNGSIPEQLPLRSRTPARWVRQVMAEPLALLNDHAHLEKKAAANALELLNRWVGHEPPADWQGTMAAVARDEVEHLAIVLRLLTRRGGRLSRSHRNPYAAALRRLVRVGRGTQESVDRLLVSALIEARSCERFKVLADHCDDRVLARLYERLFRSEAGHFQVFLNLSHQVLAPRQVSTRWNQLLMAEAEILSAQPPGPAMHSGVS